MRIEIWSEGYRATGERGSATLHGVVEAKSLKEACAKLAASDPEFARYYDPKHGTYWGCRLFGNEQDARELFG